MSQGFSESLIDVVFEVGVALIGAAVTAYILELLLNQRKDNGAIWRKEIRRSFGETQVPE
jgi:hypothetical protein